jgi:lipopolysaccharide heptosyltransferase III
MRIIRKQFETPSSILVVITRRIGDVLLTTPVIRSLRLAWPDAKIDVLVFEGTEGVLANNPDLDRIITVQRRQKFRQHLGFLKRLWRRYDLAVSMMPSDRPTLYTVIAGKHSIGLILEGGKHLWKKWLLSQSVSFDNINTHTVLMNLKLADLLGVARYHEIVLAWNAADETSVHNVLPFNPELQPYAVLHVCPKYAYKSWRNEAWVELAEWLNAQGMRVVLTGGDSVDELTFVHGLTKLLPGGTVDVAGKLHLAGVAYLLSKARAYVGPDTVVTHLAAASGVPSIALFGPSNPTKWGPWPRGYNEDRNPYMMRGTQRMNNVVLLQGCGVCVPCMEEGCDRNIASLSACLQNLPAAKAIEALHELLNLPQRIDFPETGFRQVRNSSNHLPHTAMDYIQRD